VAFIFNLNIVGAFNNVSYTRLLHNLRKKRILKYIILYVNSFLNDRYLFLIFDNQTNTIRKIYVKIPQSLPILPILFLFFNAKFIKVYK